MKDFNQYDSKIVEEERKRIMAILNKWVGRIGGGFHPDTLAKKYHPRLCNTWIKELTADLADCFDTCDTHGLDIYELAMSTDEWKKVHKE